jgi:microcystin degradation protein MlrC
VEFIVVSTRRQVYDDGPYLITGAHMSDYSIVGLKSSNHFRAYFIDTADAIIGAETPSMSPGDLTRLDYHKILRPIFPLDEGVEYTGLWP